MNTSSAAAIAWVLYPLATLFVPNDSLRIGGVPFETTYLILFVGFFAIAIGGRVAREVTRAKLWLAFLAAVAMSLLLRGDGIGAARIGTWLLVFAVTVFSARNLAFDRGVTIVYRVFALTVVLALLLGLIDLSDERVDTFGWTHRTGLGYALVPAALHGYWRIFSQKLTKQIGEGALLIALLWTLVQTSARGAWLAFALGVALVTLVERRNRPALAIVLAASMLSVAVLTAASIPQVGNRIASIVNTGAGASTGYRLDVYLSSLRHGRAAEMLVTSTPDISTKLFDNSEEGFKSYLHDEVALDSDLVWALLNFGLVPLLLLGAAFVQTCYLFIKQLLSSDAHPTGRMGLVMFPSFAVQVLLDSTLSNAYGWFQLGLIGAIAFGLKIQWKAGQ